MGFAFTVTAFSLMGLMVGGVFSIFTKARAERYEVLALSGGIVIGLLVFSVVPEILAESSGFVVGISILLGIAIMANIELVFEKRLQTMEGSLHSSFFLSLAIIMHNIPTGLSMGMNQPHSNQAYLLSILLIITFHHLPEGMALHLSFPETAKAHRLFFLTCVVLCTILGGSIFLGTVVGESLRVVQGTLGGITVGFLGYVCVQEILRKAYVHSTFKKFTQYFSIGVISCYALFLFI